MKQHVLFISALFFLFCIFLLENENFAKSTYAVDKAIYSGYSKGKLIATFAFFSLSFFILGLAAKFNISFSKRFELIFLAIFVFSISIIFILGAYQFRLFSSTHGSHWAYATIIYSNNYKNWEASKFYHNHFPKATIYFIEKLFNIDLSQKFDDGGPWYVFLEKEHLNFAPIYFIFLSLALFSFFLFLCSTERDFLTQFLFVSGALGLFIYSIDGGLAAAPITSVYFIFFLAIFRAYPITDNPHLNAFFALFSALSLNHISVSMFGFYVPTSLFQESFLLFIFFLYLSLLLAWNIVKKETMSKKEILMLTLFLLLLFFTYDIADRTLITYRNGRMLFDYARNGFKNADPGAGLFIYGLPENIDENTLFADLSNFGEVLELKKTAWTAFVRIEPKGYITDLQIANYLEHKYNPKTYLHALELAPIASYSTLYIYWDSNVKDSRKYIRNEFNDIKVIFRKDYGEKTVLMIKAYTSVTWRMLSVLSEIKANGYKASVLVAK